MKRSRISKGDTSMRALIAFLGLFLIAAFGSSPPHFATDLQEHSYTSPKVDYVVDFPSQTWKLVDEPDEIHQHTEYVYGDRNDSYLRIRKETLEEGITVNDFAHRDQDQRTRFLPGFVDGKQDPFGFGDSR